jgi:hypothetical protein
MARLQIRRGLESARTSITPLEGEPIYTTDEKKLFIGDGTTAGGNIITEPFQETFSTTPQLITTAPFTAGQINVTDNSVYVSKDSRSAGDWLRLAMQSNQFLVVANDSSGDFTTLSAAMTAATAGTTIFLKNTGTEYVNQTLNWKSGVNVISDFADIYQSNGNALCSHSTNGGTFFNDIYMFGFRVRGINNQGSGIAITGDSGLSGNMWNDTWNGNPMYKRWTKNLVMENIEIKNFGSIAHGGGANLYLERLAHCKFINVRGFNSGDDNLHWERTFQCQAEDCYSWKANRQLGLHLHRAYQCLVSGCYVELAQSDGFQFKGQRNSLSDYWGENTFLACHSFKNGLRNVAGTDIGSGFYINEYRNNYNACIACVAIHSGDASYRYGWGDGYPVGQTIMYCHSSGSGTLKNMTQTSSGVAKGVYFNGGHENICFGSTVTKSGSHGIRSMRQRTVCTYNISHDNGEGNIQLTGTANQPSNADMSKYNVTN